MHRVNQCKRVDNNETKNSRKGEMCRNDKGVKELLETHKEKKVKRRETKEKRKEDREREREDMEY